MARVKVAKLSAMAEEEGALVRAEGHEVALFKIDGEVYAIDNSCPHRMGPLSEGDVEGSTVACPWHGWRFDVTSGTNPDVPQATVRCFKVELDGDDVYLAFD